MTTLISPDDLRLAFETDLGDAALQLVIDSADAEIIARFGEHDATLDAPLVEQHDGGGRYIFPHRKVDSVVAVTEFWGGPGAEEETELAADDYRLGHGSSSLLRLSTGTNSRGWWGRVVLNYVPVTDNARRRRVELDLCKLALQYSALGSERAGDYSQSQLGDYQKERERLLSELAGFVFA